MNAVRVLHVEDDKLDQELVRDALEIEEKGFSVTVTSTLAALHEHLDDPQFDCIVSDIHLLGFDGLQVLALARDKIPDMPFVFMTGTGSEELAVEAMKRGADDYIIKKPSHVVRLPVAIRAAIDRRQTQKALRISELRTQRALEGAVQAISIALEMRDPSTAGHEKRVADLAAAIAREMGLPEDQIRGLHIAGLIHDIGKIQIPAEILGRPARLSPLEFRYVQTHAQAGSDILKNIDFEWPIADIVLQHHERLDGSGYPRGLKGDQILLEARIMAVADTVEAMSSHRPYRPSHGIDAALVEIETNSGKTYDPQVAQACLRLFRDKGYALPN